MLIYQLLILLYDVCVKLRFLKNLILKKLLKKLVSLQILVLQDGVGYKLIIDLNLLVQAIFIKKLILSLINVVLLSMSHHDIMVHS